MMSKPMTTTLRSTPKQLWHTFSRGTKVLFGIQLCSIVAFSVTLYTLGLYLVDVYQLPEIHASQIVATYAALNFSIHWLSGYLGDRWLTQRTLLLLGLICQVVGCLLMALGQGEMVIYGLATQLCGNGLCITCINCLLNQHADQAEYYCNRESAFLWNYSAMNIGFFIGLGLSGYYQLSDQYTAMFLVCAIFNGIGTLLLIQNWTEFTPITTPYFEINPRILALPIVLIALLHFALKHAAFSNHFLLIGVATTVTYLILGRTRYISDTQQDHMQLFIILSASALIFWTMYQITPITLMFFIKKHVQSHMFGIQIAPQWFENINTLIIALGGPILASGLNKLRKNHIALSLQLKFACALALISMGLITLLVGIQITPHGGTVHASWLIIKTILESLGELMLSPIGLAMVAVLIPKKWQGIAMGSWLMITGAASALAGQLTALSDINHSIHAVSNVTYYMHTLFLAATIGVMCCFALLLSSPELDPTIE